MDLLQIMRSRRSVRTYTDQPITQEQLDAVRQEVARLKSKRQHWHRLAGTASHANFTSSRNPPSWKHFQKPSKQELHSLPGRVRRSLQPRTVNFRIHGSRTVRLP